MTFIVLPPADNPQMRRAWLKKAREALCNAQLNASPMQKEWQDIMDVIAQIEHLLGVQ